MNHSYDSQGNKHTSAQVERKIRAAKAELIQNQLDEFGYNFCTVCNRNNCLPLDCSHHVSVKEAKETGRTELCWDLNNMAIVGRLCHKIKDTNLIMSGKK